MWEPISRKREKKKQVHELVGKSRDANFYTNFVDPSANSRNELKVHVSCHLEATE